MGLFDFLFGKKPSDSLPSWAKNMYTNPAPGWMNYVNTGEVPGTSSGSSSSGFSNTQSKTASNSLSQGMTQPFIKPEYLPMANTLASRVMSRLGGDGNENYLNSYQNMGLRSIGQASESALSGLEGYQAARGQDTGAGQAKLFSDRMGQQADFLNSIPLLGRNLENEDMGLAQGFLGQFGTGQQSQMSTKANSATNSNTQTGSNSSGWTSGGFDPGMYGSLLSSITPYYTAGRQGGLLSPELLGGIFGTLFGPGGKFNRPPVVNNVITGSGIGG